MEISEFKVQVTQGLIECKIKSIIIPLLGDHTLREANHFLRLLKIFKKIYKINYSINKDLFEVILQVFMYYIILNFIVKAEFYSMNLLGNWLRILDASVSGISKD